MLNSKEEITQWLKKMGINRFRINEDLTVDVGVGVDLSARGLTEIPVQFNDIDGSFFCSSNQLSSLLGSPRTVSDSFVCEKNLLTSFEHAPIYVGDSFYCSGLVNLQDLIHLELEGNFVHNCQQLHEKIAIFDSFYKEKNIEHIKQHGVEYVAYVDALTFNDAINQVKIITEKNKLDEQFNYQNYQKQGHKIKI